MTTLLTPDELAVMDLTAELANRAARIIGDGPSRAGDINEVVGHIHGVQHAIMSQAAARAYPDRFRLLGEVLTAEDVPNGGLRIVVRTGKIKVVKRFNCWHFWCPCCMGGDWFDRIQQAWHAAVQHIEKIHPN